MDQHPTLDTIELRRLVDRLFANMEAAGIRSIPINKSNYWSVFYTEAFSADHPELIVGDVLDDFEDLRNEVDGFDKGNESEAVLLLQHAFHHLSGLAKFMAYADSQGQFAFVGKAGAAACA
jgi:hypothetical protein